MLRKILSAVLLTVLLISMAAVPAMAAPYVDTKIGAGTTVIMATDFDTENYSELSTDSGMHYDARPEMEAIGGPQTEANNIGWIKAGEWVQYTVNVETAGKYKFDVSLASGDTAQKNEIYAELYYDDALIGKSGLVTAVDNGWQEYNIYPVGEIEMTAGTHVIKAMFPNGSLNISEIDVTALFDAPTTVAAAEAATKIAAAADNAATVAGDTAATTAAADNTTNNSNSMMLWILIAAGAVIVIIIIAILVTRKKK